MRKTFITSIIVAIAAVMTVSSCQDDVNVVNNEGNNTFKATATIDGGTRVSYDVDNATRKVHQSWEVGDKIVCVDNQRQTFTFTVTDVDANGVATFDTNGYDPKVMRGDTTVYAKTIYAVYYPVENAGFSGNSPTFNGNINNCQCSCSIDLTSNLTGTLENKPRLVLASTGTIEGNAVSFDFETVGSIVALEGFKAAPNAQINKVTLSGLASKGKFVYYVDYNKVTGLNVEEKGFEFAVTGTNDLVIEYGEGQELVCDADGNCASTLYFPVLPNVAGDVTISAYDNAGNIYQTILESKTVASGKYIYMTTKELAPLTVGVASVNGESYTTFDEAFAAANTSEVDCELKLLDNVTLTENKAFEYGNGRKITLNLNDYSISGNVARTTSNSDFYGLITVRCNMDILGGTNNTGLIKNTDANNGVAVSVAGAAVSHVLNVNIIGGNYYATKGLAFVCDGNGTTYKCNVDIDGEPTFESGSTYALQFAGNLIANNSIVTIHSGKFISSNSSAIRLNTGANANSELHITGGTFISKNSTINYRNAGPLVEVKGGYFSASGTNANFAKKDNTVITGGYFTSNTNVASAVAQENIIDGITYKYVVTPASQSTIAPWKLGSSFQSNL